MNLATKEPPKGTTNTQWQKYFKLMKMLVVPRTDKKMKTTYINNGRYIRYTKYSGDTQWITYCKFINDILRNIRKNETDYCFYVYQIAELLRFEPERLRAIWLEEEGCFKVYLE